MLCPEQRVMMCYFKLRPLLSTSRRFITRVSSDSLSETMYTLAVERDGYLQNFSLLLFGRFSSESSDQIAEKHESGSRRRVYIALRQTRVRGRTSHTVLEQSRHQKLYVRSVMCVILVEHIFVFPDGFRHIIERTLTMIVRQVKIDVESFFQHGKKFCQFFFVLLGRELQFPRR